MKPFFLTYLILLLPLCFALLIQEDDLVFDDVGEEASAPSKVGAGTPLNQDHQREQRHKDHKNREQKLSDENKKSRRLSTYLRIPDLTVSAEHVFKFKIPIQAFIGDIGRFEVNFLNYFTSGMISNFLTI